MNYESKKSILVVDDDPLTRKLVIAMLADLRLDIMEANSGLLALEMLRTQSFKTVITDIKMPGMDGLEFITRLQEKNIDIPVIFISGFADKEIAIRALRLGAFDFVEKPFDKVTLVDAVEEAIESQTMTLCSKLQDLNLNSTQIRVLEMLMKGLSNKEIADIVNLSEQGIKYHIGNLLKKFNSENRSTLRVKIRALVGESTI